MIKNKVIIVGGDHHNTLGVIESLGQKNIHSYVLLYTNNKRCYVLHSKYVTKGWICSTEDEMISCLLTNFQDKESKAVIIATNDISASIIDSNHIFLDDFFILPTVNPAGSLSSVMSKEYMSNLARKVGFDVPRTWIVSDNSIPVDIEYPIITKAISSVEGTKANIQVCRTKEDLNNFMVSQRKCSIIQMQSFIEKEFEFQLLGVSINEGRDIIIPGRTHIERPNGLDNTFFLKFNKCEQEFLDLITKAKQFIISTKYTGLFSIEFLRDQNNGKDYFTEMNFRNDGNAVCVTKAGTNLPYIFYLSQISENYSLEVEKSSVDITYLMPEVYYFTRLLAGELSLTEWWRNFKKTNCYTTFFKQDKRAFLWFLLIAVWKRIK